MKIIFDGELMDIESAPMTLTGWLIGSGIFETLRTEQGRTYRFSRHMRRAENSAESQKISLPNIEQIERAIESLIAADVFPNGMLRISFDSSSHWSIIHLPYKPLENSAKVGIHQGAQSHEGESIKSYPYEHRLAILESAKRLGFDDMITHNKAGNICESAVCNLLFKIDGRWVTPPTSDGLLPGIMREFVIEKLGVEIASVPLARLVEVDEGILLSSLRIAQQISRIDGREINPSRVMCDKIRDLARLDWLG